MEKNYLIPASIILSAVIIAYGWTSANQKLIPSAKDSSLSAPIVAQTVELPVVWGNLGAKMTSVGIIDRDQLSRRLSFARQDCPKQPAVLPFEQQSARLSYYPSRSE